MAYYEKLKDLPIGVQKHLPKKAQEIYLNAYNHAWNQYKRSEDRRGEATRKETAHRVAWFTVKLKYQKNAQNKWVLKSKVKKAA